MAGQLIVLCTFAVLLVVSSAKADAADQLGFLAQTAKGIEALGKNTVCVANQGDNPEIVAKAYAVFDTTVADIKAKVDGPLTEEQFASFVKIIVVDAGVGMRAVHSQCEDVSNYCSTADPPAAARTLAELGKVLQTLGATLGCLVADPKPEVLAEIPVIIGRAIQNVAAHNGASTTSVGILLPEMISIAAGFKTLSSSCRNVAKLSC